MDNKNFFISNKFSISLIDDIIEIIFFDCILEYSDVDLGIRKRLEIADNKSYPILSDLSLLKGISAEGRKRMAEDDGLVSLKAQAIIYGSKFQKIAIQMYLLIYKPSVPVKIFKDKEIALQWLKKF
ncbi:MAG: hypothetical protein PHT69_04955 [Bacteroidales bacterium]|nr:hypothetical protein [Bacteroidales bacterium]